MAAADAVRVTRLTADPWNLQYRPYNGDVRRHFFSNRVVEGWNNIPTSIKEARSIGVFKRKYDNINNHKPRVPRDLMATQKSAMLLSLERLRLISK